MNSWLIIGVLALYILVLFLCAFFGEKHASRLSTRGRMLLFSLTLGVYCSSWTFYGATGAAVREGIIFLPIYLGPLLFIWFGYDIWRRLGRVRRHHAISSIADFIAARYGKSGTLASLVTILAVIAIIPYLALQLRAIALSASVVLDQGPHLNTTTNSVLLMTGVLAILAMMFGTRQIANTEQHGGLMLAVAFESFVKLSALICVALFFIFETPNNLRQISHDVAKTFHEVQLFGVPETFWIQTLLAGLAIICLPRQFHVAVVELRDEKHIRGARRWFAVYLILTTLAIIPIASWALHAAPQFLTIPDVAVLSLPLSYNQEWLTLLAFLGGFSASTGMLLVSSVALSIMLSNDLIMPALWRFNLISRHDTRLPQMLKFTRRICILAVMLLGFLFFHFFNDIDQLSVFGLLAFSAVAQFAPALIGGLYWRGGSRQGVYAGLIVGFLMWMYTLLLPTILISLPDQYQDFSYHFLHSGPFDISWLRPEALLGFESFAPLTHGVIWALGLNIILYVWISRIYRPSVAEQIQAESFFYYETKPLPAQHTSTDMSYLHHDAARLRVGDLITLAKRITGDRPTQHAFAQFSSQNNVLLNEHSFANGMWWRFTEQYLAGTIGAASARTLLTTAMVNNGLALGQVANILDQASQWQRFNQNLLMTMIDHMTQGVSVVDENMCLVAWNNQYLKLFDYPKDLVYVGCPIADLIRYNAERGECGPGSVEEHVRKRIHWMQVGSAHEFERIRKDGRVIQMRGNPIEGGGFVTTFADITAFRENEAVLEARVMDRTQQLADALTEQQLAREQADKANMSKSRFIAAASHDLLQPMHAARLFSTVLEQSVHSEQERQTLQQLDRALYGAESMLSALLDIARLEGGSLQPKRQAYPLHDLLSDLSLQFKSIAAQRNIQLKVHDAQFWIDTDPQWIRRIIQNFVSNALRYTASGRVVVGVLRSARKPQHIRIGVWDTGPGIAEEQRIKLFQEFERCGHTSPWGEQGLGLGLAIVQRMTSLLDYPVEVYSELGKGSTFMIEVPTVPAPQKTVAALQQNTAILATGYRVLCLDNDETILDGMAALLSKWGYDVFKATEPEQALTIIQTENIQVWLIDQHLNRDQLGMDFILAHRPVSVPVALITADSDPELPQRLKEMNIVLLKKPLKPAGLRAWLSGLKISSDT
ncbi:hybrid sensor histidine kinase/response regulator [Acinetobacter ursingii]|uniref:hybrid sensor histidine kinase/response regulator n=1 Tax=Acinetobacter ursingii TaxID=108980 RepID=UPI00124D2CCA|nr:PAS domain-containing hybrid sensor histidine kinase/response regulator [Acinetobacter ursingii]MDG9859056.1 hybrid sensor histidine kinase/response regulator [Acinetobacter ursingii]MDG9892911.1 hybrid sensor histidine kinase/response regulator [Acinetobacter ursingii]MDH0006388.1 hybrid sensor histidine kinase/response regulator [Acinetobacter ursingii]MDH0477793.1 hybrid sensor histidine kinase/response regulator [Acinetobacter ursingii]MDH2118765.1 hybrid sensor histidine kinase/respons